MELIIDPDTFFFLYLLIKWSMNNNTIIKFQEQILLL